MKIVILNSIILLRRPPKFNIEIKRSPYNPRINPANTAPSEFFSNLERGGNCEYFVHATVLARGYRMCRYYRSRELGNDRIFTKPVGASEIQTGDILAFREYGRIAQDPHLGMAWVDKEGEVKVIDAAKNTGEVRIRDLADVLAYYKRGEPDWIRRPIWKDPSLAKPRELEETGLSMLIETEAVKAA